MPRAILLALAGFTLYYTGGGGSKKKKNSVQYNGKHEAQRRQDSGVVCISDWLWAQCINVHPIIRSSLHSAARLQAVTHHITHRLSTVHLMLMMHSLHCFLINAHSLIAFSYGNIHQHIHPMYFFFNFIILFSFKYQVKGACCYVLLNIILRQHWHYNFWKGHQISPKSAAWSSCRFCRWSSP